MIRVVIVLVLLLLSLAAPLHAKAIAPVEGLEALRKVFVGMTDFTAEMSQEKRLSVMKRSMQMSGTVRFRKPDLFAMEITTPYKSRMLLRDNTIEQIINGGDRSRMVLPPDQSLKRWFSRLATPITTLPEGLSVQADLTDRLYTITISPQGKGQLKELLLSFHEDGTIRKLVIAEQNGDRSTLTFKKVRRNVGLTEKDFRIE